MRLPRRIARLTRWVFKYIKTTAAVPHQIRPMDPENKNVVSDVDISEHEKSAGGKAEERRAELVAYLGLEDNDANKPLIDKFFTRESGLRSGYGKLLGNFKELKKGGSTSSNPSKSAKQGDFDPEKFRIDTEAAVASRFNEEFLEESDFSDGLKAEIRKIIKLNNVSARAAMKDPYIKYLHDGEVASKRVAEAANNGDGAGKSGKEGDASAMPDKFTDPKFMLTEQGRKEYEEWLASKK